MENIDAFDPETFFTGELEIWFINAPKSVRMVITKHLVDPHGQILWLFDKDGVLHNWMTMASVKQLRTLAQWQEDIRFHDIQGDSNNA